MFQLAETPSTETLTTAYWNLSSKREQRLRGRAKYEGMRMRLRIYQWLYLIIVGLLCAPALLLSGSLQGLQNRESANKCAGDDV
jgi:hypothetical protein